MSKENSRELNAIGNAGLRFYIKICKAYNEYIEELNNIEKYQKEKLKID